MPHSFLIFDFGTNEEAAQQARHRLEGWKQGFRLDKKLQLKFERKEKEAEASTAAGSAKPAKSSKTASAGKGKAKTPAKSKSNDAPVATAEADGTSDIRVIVRLDFSDHEKLSHQRWLERIPTEEPFRSASPRVVRTGEADFRATSDLFDSLD